MIFDEVKDLFVNGKILRQPVMQQPRLTDIALNTKLALN